MNTEQLEVFLSARHIAQNFTHSSGSYDAEDVMQSAWIRANSATYREGNLKGFYNTIVRRQAIDLHRREHLHRSLEELQGDVETYMRKAPIVDTLADSAEVKGELANVLDDLNLLVSLRILSTKSWERFILLHIKYEGNVQAAAQSLNVSSDALRRDIRAVTRVGSIVRYAQQRLELEKDFDVLACIKTVDSEIAGHAKKLLEISANMSGIKTPAVKLGHKVPGLAYDSVRQYWGVTVRMVRACVALADQYEMKLTNNPACPS